MLLVFDIGNTNVCVGCFEGEKLALELRLKTDPQRTVDELCAVLGNLFEKRLGDSYEFDSAIISSVVPPVTPDFVKLCREMLDVEPLLVGPGMKTGIALNVQEPAAVGADRVVNAVAAKIIYGCPSLVVDFGTATTFDLVGPEGNFEGGMICPGMGGSLDSLVRNTSKLPRIELAWPKSVMGKNTISAMQAGVVVGYICMVDGLVEKLRDEFGAINTVISTGGLGKLAAEHSKHIKIYDPHLTLKGLKILAEMNVSR